MQPVLFNRFKSPIAARGAGAVNDSASILASSDTHTVRYIPFEHVNVDARLVIVGITPGPRQMALGYDAVRILMRSGTDDARVLAETKREGAFGGPTMRPKLLQMLHAFGIHRILGLDDASRLWTDRSDLLHATSVVPHAAFKGVAPFNGSFNEVLGSPVLKDQFEAHFVPSIQAMNPAALYIGLGRTPLEALKWCVAQGVIRADQMLGAFAHPSSSGGSEVDVYVGAKKVGDLNPKDPVRHRAAWLAAESHRMDAATRCLGGGLERGSAPLALVPQTTAGVHLPRVAETTTPRVLAKSATTLPLAELAAALAKMSSGEVAAVNAVCDAGYEITKVNVKLCAFRRSSDGVVVYMPRTATKLQIVVHPDIAPRASRAALHSGAVGGNSPYHNANMAEFPSRLNGGSKPEKYGYGFSFSGVGRLRDFLEAL